MRRDMSGKISFLVLIYRKQRQLFVRKPPRLHIEPRLFGARAVEHVDAERQVVAGKAPRAEDVDILGADAVP